VARSLPARPLLLLLVLAGALALPASTLADTEPLFQFPQLTVTIRGTSGHAVKFQVWLADTPHREEQGLMFVRDLDEHGGMLFRFPAPQRIPMWMKNTYIPLDMIFLSRQGVVVHIEADTEPMSEDILASDKPAFAVLEVNAGYCRKIGLKPGDRVRHALFAP